MRENKIHDVVQTKKLEIVDDQGEVVAAIRSQVDGGRRGLMIDVKFKTEADVESVFLGARDDEQGMIQVFTGSSESVAMGGGDEGRGYITVGGKSGDKAVVVGADEERGNYVAFHGVDENEDKIQVVIRRPKGGNSLPVFHIQRWNSETGDIVEDRELRLW